MSGVNAHTTHRRTTSVLVVVHFLFALFTDQSSTQPLWTWQNPYPQGTDINGISFPDSLHGYTVGIFGSINRTTDGGQTWIHCQSGVPHDLKGVSFSDANTGTAVGLGGTIVRTTDGGLSWIKTASGTTTMLRAVSFTSMNNGTAVGISGTILRTTDAGTTWSLQASGTSNHLNGVSFSDADHGIAVGFDGVVVWTSDGGSSWHPGTSGTIVQLNGVELVNAGTGTAVGTGGTIIMTTDGGVTWSPQTSGTVDHLYGVSFSGIDDGVVVGDNGIVRRTTDGGSTWNPGSSGTTMALFGVSSPDPASWWSVGRFGTLIHTADGGAVWSTQTKGTRRNLHGVAFTDSLTGYAVGDSGLILQTVDGGASWTTYHTGIDKHLIDISFSDHDNGIIVGSGGTILNTHDGGMTWTERASGITKDIYSVAFPTPIHAYTVGVGYLLRSTDGGDSWETKEFLIATWIQSSIFMLDQNHGVNVGQGGTGARTVDGWQASPLNIYSLKYWPYQALRDVYLFAGDVGIAVGLQGYMITSTQVFTGPDENGWTSLNSGTTKNLYAIDFLDSSSGLIVGAEGTLRRTSDRGMHWTGEVSGTGDDLNDVAFVDPTRAWVVGDQGAILRYTPVVADTGLQFNVRDKWNIVSVPYGVGDYSATTLFPAAVSSAFGFENGYVAYDTLENGRGYWLKFPQAQTVVMNGTPLEAETVDVDAGWNMVGSLNSPVDVATISSIPGGIVTSGFYQYDGSYQQSTVIIPGKGYWVKCSQPGQLVFSSAGNTPAASRIRIEDRGETPPAPPNEQQAQGMSMPLAYSLSQNTPNPFNPTTQISYSIPIRSQVTLKVYNVLGQLVTTLADEILSPGEHTVLWDAGGLPSGVYFYRIVSGPFTHTLKMVVMK